MAALVGEERAAREKNSPVKNEEFENSIINETADKAEHVDVDKLEDALDENSDKLQPQVLPETEAEAEAEAEMPILMKEEISPPNMENKYGISVADSVVQQGLNQRNEDRLYSHRTALLARMTSLSGTGSGTLSGDTADTSLERGPYLSLIPPNPSTKYFSYNAFQSASLKVILMKAFHTINFLLHLFYLLHIITYYFVLLHSLSLTNSDQPAHILIKTILPGMDRSRVTVDPAMRHNYEDPIPIIAGKLPHRVCASLR